MTKHRFAQILDGQVGRSKTSVRTEFKSRPWLWETLALALGAVVVVLLAVILRIYDGQSIDKWAFLANLNSAVALMVTVLYMLLMFPLASSLSQLKWNHFHSDSLRPLHDFQILDQASRGVTGSAALLLRKPKGFKIVLAAFIVITINAIGPLAQQIISTELQSLPGPKVASMPMSRMTFNWPKSRSDYSGLQPSPLGNQKDRMVAGIDNLLSPNDVWAPDAVTRTFLEGIYRPNDMSQTVTYTCQSTNCTWPQSTTLGFSTDCYDLSDMLTVDRDFGTKATSVFHKLNGSSTVHDPADSRVQAPTGPIAIASLPNGFNISLSTIYKSTLDRLGIGSQMSTYLDAMRGPGSHVSLSSRRTPLKVRADSGTVLVVQAIYLETGPTSNTTLAVGKTRALECSLSMVASEILANTTNNEYSERYPRSFIWADPVSPSAWSSRDFIVNTESRCQWPIPNWNLVNASDVLICGEINVEGEWRYQKMEEPRWSSLDGNWAVDPIGTAGLAASLADVFDGNTSSTWWSNTTSILDLPYNSLRRPMHPHDVSQYIMDIYMDQQKSNLSLRMSNVTLGRILYNAASSLSYFLRESSNTPIHGVTYVTQAAYRVHWEWISLPVVFITLVSFVTFATAIDTRRKRVPFWTDSAIAVMFHGLSPSIGHQKIDVSPRSRALQPGPGITADVSRCAGSLHQAAKGIKVRLRPGDNVLEHAVPDKERTSTFDGNTSLGGTKNMKAGRLPLGWSGWSWLRS